MGRGLGALLVAFLLFPPGARAGTAEYEFVATLMSPCIFGTQHGGVQTMSSGFRMTPAVPPGDAPNPGDQIVWRFPTTTGQLFVSVPRDQARRCSVTAYQVKTTPIHAELLGSLGQPVQRSIGDSIHEVFAWKTGGTVTVDIWPMADAGRPSIVAEYSAPPPL